MQRGIPLVIASMWLWTGVACGAHCAQDTHPGVDEVLGYLRSTSAMERGSGCLLIQRATWSPEEAKAIVGELSRMIVAYSDVSLVLPAVEYLARSHPGECEPALHAMNRAISERLRPDDWQCHRDACYIVRALGKFGPRAAFARGNLEAIMRRERSFPSRAYTLLRHWPVSGTRARTEHSSIGCLRDLLESDQPWRHRAWQCGTVGPYRRSFPVSAGRAGLASRGRTGGCRDLETGRSTAGFCAQHALSCDRRVAC